MTLNKAPVESESQRAEKTFKLRLFITGASPNSTRAIANLKIVCDQYIPDDYELEVIDVYQQPLIAQREQIIALPMVVKLAPGSERRLIGDMSDTEKVLRGLEFISK